MLNRFFNNHFLNQTVGAFDNTIKNIVNTALNNIQPTTILVTLAEYRALTLDDESDWTTYATVGVATFLQIRNYLRIYAHWDKSAIVKQAGNSVTQLALSAPIVGDLAEKMIVKEAKKLLQKSKDEQDERYKKLSVAPIESLPNEGMTPEAIQHFFNELKSLRVDTNGKMSGAQYTSFSPALKALLEKLFAEYALTNPLHPDAWPDVVVGEAILGAVTKDLSHAPASAHMLLTGGGTPSIIEACNAYAQYARNVRKILNPEIIVPKSVHFAFDKAASLENVNLVYVDIDPKTGQVDLAQLQTKITENTILLVGSAPSFPYGVIDPIEEMGQIAINNNIFLHVDMCLGGYLKIFLSRQKHPNIPVTDFRIPGVNSISADMHKYGCTMKESSALIFRDDTLFSPTTDYTSLDRYSLYVTNGYLQGSRSGVTPMLTLAILLYYGRNEYENMAEKIIEIKNKLVQTVKNEVKEIHIPFNPALSVVYMQTANNIDHHKVVKKIEEKGWILNDFKTGFHLCITKEHDYENFVAAFVQDMQSAVEYVKQHPDEKLTGTAKAYKYVDLGLPRCIQNLFGHLHTLILRATPSTKISQFWTSQINQSHAASQVMDQSTALKKRV